MAKKSLVIKIIILFYLLSLAGFWLTNISLAWTLGEPLVPCGGSGQPECTQCELLHLVKNLIDFIMIAASPILATLFFIIAGVYIMLGGANPGMLAQGKSMFKNTFIGILIVMLAWLITNTLIQTLVDESALSPSSGNWWTLTCSDIGLSTTPIPTPLPTPIPTIITPTPTPTLTITPTPSSTPPGCPVSTPLSWSGSDPYGIDWSGAVPELQPAYNAFNQAMGRTQPIISVWRPQAYQDHIRTTWDAWMLANGNSFTINDATCSNNGTTVNPPIGWQNCSTLRSQLVVEAQRHSFSNTRPACTSDHIRGIAIDIQPPAVSGSVYTNWINTANNLTGSLRLCHYIAGDEPHFGLYIYLPSGTNCLQP